MKASPLSCWLISFACQALAGAVPVDAKAAQCPGLHIFGARETTAPQGFGTAKQLIDLIRKIFPEATAEDIIYPAVGGDEYGASVEAGIAAVLKQMDAFQKQCPDSIIIMHGYSQVRSWQAVHRKPRNQD